MKYFSSIFSIRREQKMPKFVVFQSKVVIKLDLIIPTLCHERSDTKKCLERISK